MHGEENALDVPNEAVWPFERHEPCGQRAQDANEEEPHEGVVDLPRRELSLRANDTPNDGRGTEHLRARTYELVLLRQTAHIGDMREHPRLYAELDGARDDRGKDLRPEHRPRGNLHVVAKLEIGRELQGLGHGDVPPRFEHHHGERPARQRVPDDKFSDHVQANLLVGDSLDHPDGDYIHERDQEGKDETPYGELGGPYLDTDDAKDEHDEEDDGVPPAGNLGVAGHEAGVYVGLFVQ